MYANHTNVVWESRSSRRKWRGVSDIFKGFNIWFVMFGLVQRISSTESEHTIKLSSQPVDDCCCHFCCLFKWPKECGWVSIYRCLIQLLNWNNLDYKMHIFIIYLIWQFDLKIDIQNNSKHRLHHQINVHVQLSKSFASRSPARKFAASNMNKNE